LSVNVPPAKVGDEDVVNAWPVLNASWSSPIASPVTDTPPASAVMAVPPTTVNVSSVNVIPLPTAKLVSSLTSQSKDNVPTFVWLFLSIVPALNSVPSSVIPFPAVYVVSVSVAQAHPEPDVFFRISSESQAIILTVTSPSSPGSTSSPPPLSPSPATMSPRVSILSPSTVPVVTFDPSMIGLGKVVIHPPSVTLLFELLF